MDPIISIRISHQRGVDAVLTDAGCDAIDEFSQDCYAPGVVTPFISKYAEHHTGLAIVISPFDPWPPHLLQAVESLGVPIRWVSPTFLRDAYEGVSPWRQRRRQYRARFLAHVYYSQQSRRCEFGFEAGTEWERQLAQKTLEAIETERSKMYDF